MKYRARLINHGQVRQVMDFEATNNLEAYAEANHGIDPITGAWVECTRRPTNRPSPTILQDLAKSPAFSAAVRKSLSLDQGHSPKDSRSAAPETNKTAIHGWGM